jgi:hypothetical protein
MYADTPHHDPSPHLNRLLEVSPGDYIDASVTYLSDGSFELRIANTTSGHTYSTTQYCPTGHICPRVSAEIIVERPGDPVHFPLGDFGTLTFSELGVTASSADNFRRLNAYLQLDNSAAILSECAIGKTMPGRSGVRLNMPAEVVCKWLAATP